MWGWAVMEIALGGGFLCILLLTVPVFSFLANRQEKGNFGAREHRDGRASVAAGHTSGGTVGQRTCSGRGDKSGLPNDL